MSRTGPGTTSRGGATNDRPTVCVVGTSEDDTLPGLVEAVGNDVDLRFAPDLRRLRERLPGAEVALVADFRSPLLEQAWDAATELEWVHVAGAGVDAVLFPELADSHVTVTNARGVFDDAIAEYVLGLMLAFVKDLPTTLELQRRREWRHRETERLAGRQVLVVGAGGIGRAIGRIAKAVGMTTGGVARNARHDPDLGEVVAQDELDQALPTADFVVLAVPLTEETRGMFGREELAAMSGSARLINIARGQILEEESLLDALDAGRLAGAALDVFATEPLPEDHPLWAHPKVIVSPHMSADFIGWRRALTDLFAENLRRWLEGHELENVVDKRRGYVPTGDHGEGEEDR